jgi:hypothetical protein
VAANDLPRGERRRISVDLIGRGEDAKRIGLPVPPDPDVSIGLALAMRRLLAKTDDANRATAAAAFGADVLQATLTRQVAGEPIACQRGCAHCCKSLVTCSAPEIFRVAAEVRLLSAEAQRAVIDRVHRRRARSVEELLADKVDCPLLDDGACVVYVKRPLACRQLFSLSAEACEQAVAEGSEQVPLLVPPMQLGELVRTMLFAAMRAEGMAEIGYDLAEGLAVALEADDSEARWLDGEDVFAGVRSAVRPARATAATDRIVGVLQGLEY